MKGLTLQTLRSIAPSAPSTCNVGGQPKTGESSGAGDVVLADRLAPPTFTGATCMRLGMPREPNRAAVMVPRIIRDMKGPGQMQLEVMCRGPRAPARCLESMTTLQR